MIEGIGAEVAALDISESPLDISESPPSPSKLKRKAGEDDGTTSPSKLKRKAGEDDGTTDAVTLALKTLDEVLCLERRVNQDLQAVFNKLYGKLLPSGKAGESLDNLIAKMQQGLDACGGALTQVDLPQSPIPRLEAAFKEAVDKGGKFATRNTAIGREWTKYLKKNPQKKVEYEAAGRCYETQNKIRAKWCQTEYTDIKDACQIAEVYQFKIRHCSK